MSSRRDGVWSAYGDIYTVRLTLEQARTVLGATLQSTRVTSGDRAGWTRYSGSATIDGSHPLFQHVASTRIRVRGMAPPLVQQAATSAPAEAAKAVGVEAAPSTPMSKLQHRLRAQPTYPFKFWPPPAVRELVVENDELLVALLLTCPTWSTVPWPFASTPAFEGSAYDPCNK